MSFVEDWFVGFLVVDVFMGCDLDILCEIGVFGVVVVIWQCMLVEDFQIWIDGLVLEQFFEIWVIILVYFVEVVILMVCDSVEMFDCKYWNSFVSDVVVLVFMFVKIFNIWNVCIWFDVVDEVMCLKFYFDNVWVCLLCIYWGVGMQYVLVMFEWDFGCFC